MNAPNIMANAVESLIIVGLAAFIWLKRRRTDRIARRKEAESCSSARLTSTTTTP